MIIDKYFERSKLILKSANINPLVRYQVFARTSTDNFKGINNCKNFILGATKNKVKIQSIAEGSVYSSGDPIMFIEGRVQDLIDLETHYLGILSAALTGNIDYRIIKKNAQDIIEEAKGKPVFYFGARHFHPALDKDISSICKEAGFSGCSTDNGAEAWGTKGIGTVPHALILTVYAYMLSEGIDCCPTLKTMELFANYIPKEVSRIALIDTFNREITDSLYLARKLPSLKGIRIDTCGSNYSEGVECTGERGVTISAVTHLRNSLIDCGYPWLSLTVSSGFNSNKIRKFICEDKKYQIKTGLPLFHSIGTGSIYPAAITTSDIIEYFDERFDRWLPVSKVGRSKLSFG